MQSRGSSWQQSQRWKSGHQVPTSAQATLCSLLLLKTNTKPCPQQTHLPLQPAPATTISKQTEHYSHLVLTCTDPLAIRSSPAESCPFLPALSQQHSSARGILTCTPWAASCLDSSLAGSLARKAFEIPQECGCVYNSLIPFYPLIS